MPRDISREAFSRKCEQYGFKPTGFLGYYALPCGVNVSILNAGSGASNRIKLAFLISENERMADYLDEQREKKK